MTVWIFPSNYVNFFAKPETPGFGCSRLNQRLIQTRQAVTQDGPSLRPVLPAATFSLTNRAQSNLLNRFHPICICLKVLTDFQSDILGYTVLIL